MDTERELINCLEQILEGHLPSPESLSALPKPENRLQELVCQILFQSIEAQYFLEQLASGNLKITASRGNVFLGSAKELQSVLRSILWNCERISKGDYTQTVEFMGEFSTAYNFFIGQVAKREAYQREIVCLEREKLEQRNSLLMDQLEQQLAYYESLKSMQDRVRGIRHDIRNHCLAFETLLNKEDVEGARAYLQAVSGQLFIQQDPVYYTGNPMLDAILTDKSLKAKEKGIEVTAGFALKENLPVANEDWVVLLGNTLDNAIEACERLQKEPKKITFEARYHKNLLNITIRNTALPPRRREDGLFCTSKEDSSCHGIGLSNVLRVVEKYDGVLQTNYREGWFTLALMLCEL